MNLAIGIIIVLAIATLIIAGEEKIDGE